MGDVRTLSDAQERLLAACLEKRSNPDVSLRSLSVSHTVSYSAIQRAVKRPATARVILDNAETLLSDGTVEDNGTVRVSTTSGATLTSDNVIAAVRAADERKRDEEARKAAAAAQRERRRAERSQEDENRKRKSAEREEMALRKLKRARLPQRLKATETRAARRERARQRCASSSASTSEV